jgi:photosystem II PsbU protein
VIRPGAGQACSVTLWQDQSLQESVQSSFPFPPFKESVVMKRLLAWLMSGVVLAGLLVTLLLPQPALATERRNVADDKIAESAGKVDLNNSSVRRFQQYPGMYPTLAGKIVLGGPYQNVDDVLKLDLTIRQKELFEKYKNNFTVTDPSIALNEGFDRINDGVYR